MTITTSPFPPSFDGNPWTYGLALFSLTLVSSMSLAQILDHIFEERRHRAINRLVHNLAPQPVPRQQQPMTTHIAFRRIVFCFLLMAFAGAGPDSLILFCWGEASDRTMEWLYLLDRLGDGFVMVPFAVAQFLLIRTRQAIPQQLAKAAMIPLSPFRWAMLRENAKIIAVVLFLAIGVTIGKASV